MNIYDDLSWRGLINQTSDDAALRAHLATPGRGMYCGFDPTASSLHIGNLVPLLALLRMQRAGHAPVVLLGGATGLIGDPSGKDKERQLKTPEEIAASAERIRQQVTPLFKLDGDAACKVRVVDNHDWIGKLSAIELLRDVGKHFTINYMLAKDSVKGRIGREETGISYTEFSYMILQAYDFYHLASQAGVSLQIGGSDQFGNITAGLELIRRKLAGKECYALTFPLITTASGAKFGKSEKGAIWLDPERTSPYAFYQYWMNADDRDVINYLKYFTFLSENEIVVLERELADSPHLRAAQKTLAGLVTEMIHGASETENVVRVSEALFGKAPLSCVDVKTLLAAIEGAPGKTYASLDEIPALPELLVELGLAPSRAQAKKDIKAGGVYINNQRVADEAFRPAQGNFVGEMVMLVRRGKKSYAVVTWDKPN
ncbi:MAG: tyrosine--tRNA ligase [Desulfovibrionaceae bacterium]|nr:tyrosine--tRNA ligase [Desulfovibrionaceae bacterium]MBF0513015.1 tyrosine--tRNA ligase [Desulfovibrionaceae bacterium]